MSFITGARASGDSQSSAGVVRGATPVDVFGGGSVLVPGMDVWTHTANLVWPTVATQLSMVSTSADDSASGPGARLVRVKGLLADFSEAFEDVATDGLTPVSTVNSYIRCNRTGVRDVGEYGGANVGLITISHGANPISLIQPLEGISIASHYTIPALLLGLAVSIEIQADKAVRIQLQIRPGADVVTEPYRGQSNGAIRPFVNATAPLIFDADEPMNPGTDIWLRVSTVAGPPVDVWSHMTMSIFEQQYSRNPAVIGL